MDWEFSPLVLISFLAAILLIELARRVWQKHAMPGSIAFASLMLAGAVWAVASALEILAQSKEADMIWSQFGYIGIVCVPPLWLIFALQYTRRSIWLFGRRFGLLFIIPLLTLLFVFTNAWHGWIWSNIYAYTDPGVYVYEHGWWFAVWTIYSYTCMLLGTLVLAWAIFRFPKFYQQQAVILLIGATIPWVVNAVYLNGIISPTELELTPLAFLFTGLIYWLGIFRLRMFDLVPVARDMLIELMRDGVIVLDNQDRVVDINPAATRLLGLTSPLREERIEKILAHWPEGLAFIASSAEAQQEIQFGEKPEFVEVNVTVLHDERNTLLGKMVLLRDVTERKQVEQQIKMQSIALESAASAIAILNRAGAFLWANPAYTRLTGYSLEELLGETPRILKSGLHNSEYYQTMWDTLLAGKVWHGETVNRRKDGSLYTEEQTITPVLDEKGEVNYFITIKLDISEQKKAEMMRNDMTNMMVHDLRNPLSNIIFCLDLMARGKELAEDNFSEAERAQMLKIAQQSTNRMLDLLNSILDINRLENGQMTLELTQVDLRQLISDAVGSELPVSTAKNISLSVDFSQNLEMLCGDVSILRRVLQNLIGNAVKFTPAGGRVTVKAESIMDEESIRVSVIDSGLGISEDVVGRLFEKFATGRIEGSGTGLGLAFCKLAVEAHGGRIWVESEAGQGSTFVFQIPMKGING